ncbi:BCD family chlorophyll transporter-like MFS transporter [Natronocella acetinitrilica]|uniref:BCD family chlorophyll transporter-like MFS transporter n=1 Tax=Natronocella acetinitrilica TaxID=414046 RepID=A0AAE3G7J1_9GAMM|nr:BCD family chlorophyll transporter-like MFS transporter [Natronocella acetinitrilica]
MTAPWLGWFGIFRLGLVQTALGAIVILTTTTLNRVMVVELALPAMLPGILVGFYYGMQLLRPRLGYGSDVGGRRTPWIIGGMCLLAIGGVTAAAATAWMATAPLAGIALAFIAFLIIGVGVGAAGTALLTLLAKRVEPTRRGAAAMIVWVMMIAGFAVTATLAGNYLDPFTLTRLVAVTAVVCGAALLLAVVAVYGVEGKKQQRADTPAPASAPEPTAFRQALRQVWQEPTARRFTIFVFVSMLAYSAQDLILEPFAGIAFGLTPGESTRMAGLQNAGVLCGMLLAAAGVSRLGCGLFGTLRHWTIGGCIASALALVGLAFGAYVGPVFPLHPAVFVLGIANGAFAVAAIGSMMRYASAGRTHREGVRMGLWGAAQAIAFGVGGFLGTVGVDVTTYLIGAPIGAYGLVFASSALLFLVAAALCARVEGGEATHTIPQQGPVMGDGVQPEGSTP